jgi:hypothetical protein
LQKQNIKQKCWGVQHLCLISSTEKKESMKKTEKEKGKKQFT